jgi:hypothetical protein
MKRIETNLNGSGGSERFSHRWQHGVEILERDTITTIKIKGSQFQTVSQRTPRLIVSDPARTSAKPLIAKKRSDVSELHKFLQSISSAIKAK